MGKAYAWKFSSCERVKPHSDLKELSKTYLASRKIVATDPNHGHLKLNGMPGSCYISRCIRHIDCKRKYRFTLRGRDVLAEERLDVEGDDFLLVQDIGVCDGPDNVEVLKKHWCHTYAGTGTPDRILQKMSVDGIPQDQRPSSRQLEARNAYLRGAGGRRFDGKFVESMKAFCKDPPKGTRIWLDESIVDEKTVRIAFSVNALTPKATELQKSGDVFWVMDGTFNTNLQGLVLIGVGPAGIGIERNLPTMKALPYSFVIASAEDAEACKLAIRQALFLHNELVPDNDLRSRLKDACVDGSGGFANALQEELPRTWIHRCLEHVKKNIKDEAPKMVDRATGKRRMTDRKELLPHLIDHVNVSSKFGVPQEFSVCWEAVIARLKDPDDWNEPDEAAYLMENVLYRDEQGLLRAKWESGTGSMPPGFTTYVQNSLESRWRRLKACLPKGSRWQDMAGMVCEVAACFTSWVETKRFDNWVTELEMVSTLLHNKDQMKSQRILEGDAVEEADGKVQKNRLTLESIRAHHEEHGDDGTFIYRDGNFMVERNGTTALAKRVYVFPKYKLGWATDKQSDMRSMLALGTASGPDQILHALGGPPYSFKRHRYLRENFTAVYVMEEDNHVVDTHIDYIKFVGHTEHTYFIRSLPSVDSFDARAMNASQGTKRVKQKVKRARAKMSTAGKLKIKTPPPPPLVQEAGDVDDAGGLSVLPFPALPGAAVLSEEESPDGAGANAHGVGDEDDDAIENYSTSEVAPRDDMESLSPSPASPVQEEKPLEWFQERLEERREKRKIEEAEARKVDEEAAAEAEKIRGEFQAGREVAKKNAEEDWAAAEEEGAAACLFPQRPPQEDPIESASQLPNLIPAGNEARMLTRSMRRRQSE